MTREPRSRARIATREAAPRDLPLILSFIREKSVFDGCPDAVEATEEKLERILFRRNPACGVLFAFSGRRPVGFAFYFETHSSFLAGPCLWLDDLYVRPEFRGCGAGSALMRHLARVARRRGCGRIDWTVSVSNGRGITFYQNHGAALKPEVQLCRINRTAIAALATGN